MGDAFIISLNQNIKDAVAAHKRHRKFVDVMEGRGFAPVSALSDEPPVVVAGAEDAFTVDVGGEVVEEAARYAERERARRGDSNPRHEGRARPRRAPRGTSEPCFRAGLLCGEPPFAVKRDRSRRSPPSQLTSVRLSKAPRLEVQCPKTIKR